MDLGQLAYYNGIAEYEDSQLSETDFQSSETVSQSSETVLYQPINLKANDIDVFFNSSCNVAEENDDEQNSQQL